MDGEGEREGGEIILMSRNTSLYTLLLQFRIGLRRKHSAEIDGFRCGPDLRSDQSNLGRCGATSSLKSISISSKRDFMQHLAKERNARKLKRDPWVVPSRLLEKLL